MAIVVKPLCADLAEDYLRFFDSAAFADNPEWSGCYCCFYHFTRGWEKRTAAQNRDFANDAIKSGAMRGYLAYDGIEVVGWVNAGPRSGYARLKNEGLPDGNVLSIVCYVISPSRRRQGIATLLLQAVLEGAKGTYSCVEAYPRLGEQTAAHHYHGPYAMYEKAGFTKAASMDGFDVVRNYFA